MHKKKIWICSWKVLLVFLVCGVWIISGGVCRAAFEELITTGARAQGMGEAFCGIGGDVSGILINPAGIGILDKIQVSFTGSFPFLGMLENDLLMNHFAAFATPVMKGHTVGGGINYFKANKYNEMVFFGTYAYKLFEDLTVAGTLKYLSWDSAESKFYSGGVLDMEDLRWDGISVDAGLFYKPGENVGLGLVVTDINQPNIVSTGSVGRCTDPLPLGLRAGASFSVFDFIVDFDYIYKYYQLRDMAYSTICLGMERDLKEIVGLPILVRGGVTFLDMAKGTNVSVGGSYRQTEGFAYQIDYAMNIYLMDAVLLTHRFSFSTTLETFEEMAKRAAEERKRKAEEERARLEEEARKKAEAEARRKELEEEKKRKEEEEARRILEEKMKKEEEEKLKAQEAERLRLEAEKIAKEAELAAATKDAERLKAEAERLKAEAEKAKTEAEKAKAEAEAAAEKERQARLEAEAKVSELKAKLDALSRERPKEVTIRETTRGLSVNLAAAALFATGKSVLSPAARPLLDRIIEVINACPENYISVEGHTDSIGSRDANIKLSTARAEAVAKYLIEKGVAMERISSAGYGPDRPIASNATKEGREQNRRIEIIILK